MADYTFTDLTKPGRRAVWATGIFAVTQVGYALVHMYQNAVIRQFIDGNSDVSALERTDSLIAISAIFFLVALLLAFVVNGRFLYLASRNAAAIHYDPEAIRPGWAVGWYFVPIANLWMPFTAMKQTWSRLIPSDDQTPRILTFWWVSWVGMNFYDGFVTNRLEPNTLPDYLTYNQSLIISGFVWLIPCYLFINIISRLSQAEHNPAEVFA